MEIVSLSCTSWFLNKSSLFAFCHKALHDTVHSVSLTSSLMIGSLLYDSVVTLAFFGHLEQVKSVPSLRIFLLVVPWFLLTGFFLSRFYVTLESPPQTILSKSIWLLIVAHKSLFFFLWGITSYLLFFMFVFLSLQNSVRYLENNVVFAIYGCILLSVDT